MLTDVLEYYGLNYSFRRFGFKEAFQTKQTEKLEKDLKTAVCHGNLVVIAGMMGIGKTTTIKMIKENLAKGNEVQVCQSLSLEKQKVNLVTLMTAIFNDIATNKGLKLPSQQERRERALCDLIGKSKKPVALFIDEAHDLNGHTLIGLKRLIETVQEFSKGTLAIVLVGHPRLKNAMCRARMEEIGARTEILEVEGMQEEERRAYTSWLVGKCKKKNVKNSEIIESEAINFIANRLTTPLQIEQALELATSNGFKIGQKPITADLIEMSIALDINDIEAKLARFGYSTNSVAEVLNIKPAEAKKFVRGKLASTRFDELSQSLKAAGIPL